LARPISPKNCSPAPHLHLHLQAFAPRTIPTSKREAVAAFVRDANASVAPENVYTVEQTTAPIVALTNWAHVTCGLALGYVVLFAPATIKQFLTQAVANNELATGTARNYRAHLSHIATARGIPVAGSPAPPSPPCLTPPAPPPATTNKEISLTPTGTVQLFNGVGVVWEAALTLMMQSLPTSATVTFAVLATVD
jgi:hypothetical protein